MEVKFIIYIIGGILYFLYTRAQEAKKNQSAQPENSPQQATEQVPVPPVPPRPVRPPAGNPFDDARREMKRKQAAVEAQKKLSAPAPQTLLSSQKMDEGKELFIHEKKKATFGQGFDDAPVYEDTQATLAKTGRNNIRLENEGIYRTETMEEARALADAAGGNEFEFDAKQAFIGSVIFERKY